MYLLGKETQAKQTRRLTRIPMSDVTFRSASQISQEKPGVDMRRSAADPENAHGSGSGKDAAKDRQIGSNGKDQGGTNPPSSREDLGGSKARKGQ